MMVLRSAVARAFLAFLAFAEVLSASWQRCHLLVEGDSADQLSLDGERPRNRPSPGQLSPGWPGNWLRPAWFLAGIFLPALGRLPLCCGGILPPLQLSVVQSGESSGSSLSQEPSLASQTFSLPGRFVVGRFYIPPLLGASQNQQVYKYVGRQSRQFSVTISKQACLRARERILSSGWRHTSLWEAQHCSTSTSRLPRLHVPPLASGPLQRLVWPVEVPPPHPPGQPAARGHEPLGFQVGRNNAEAH